MSRVRLKVAALCDNAGLLTPGSRVASVSMSEAELRTKTIIAVSLALFASPALSRGWEIGQEREVDEGYYFTLLSSENGWRVWQIETREGTRCTAVKSVRGKPHPEPLGVADSFWKGTPYLVVTKGHEFPGMGRVWRFQLRGHFGSGEKAQLRPVGARFWSDWTNSQELAEYDGKQIEVAISTYEYPHSLVGGVHEKGILDLTGLSDVVQMVENCGTLNY